MNTTSLVKKAGLLVGLLLLALVALPRTVTATEGGGSVYAPGSYGNFGMGVLPPQPGVYFNNFGFWYSGSVDKTVLDGHIQIHATQNAYVNLFAFTNATSWELLGGRYFNAAFFPVASASLTAEATLDAFGNTLARSVAGSQFGAGDPYIIPFGLAWKAGDVSIAAYEGVSVPLGEYNMNNLVSIGLNYWASDTNIAASYRNPKTGFTIGADAGYLINSINPATQYQSGQVFHLDANVGWYLSQRFAVGLVGYAFQQTSGDSGSGALLGPFEGRAYGIGPAVQGITVIGTTPFVLELQWIHQFGVVNQFAGDFLQFNVSVKL